MAMFACERCGRQAYLLENCMTCSKAVCRACEKSAQRIGKTKRLVICGTCWSDLAKRGRFKSA